MVAPRHQRYVDPGELTGFPDLRDVRPEWHDRAACAGEKDEKLFFGETPLYMQPKMLKSASLLLPLLICSTCPVRPECLRAAFTPPVVFHDEDDYGPALPRTMGVWGGSFESDRNELRDFPTIEAKIEALEETFPARLAPRIEAWRTGLAERRANHGAVRERDKRIEAMLGEEGVTRFVLGVSPGPGRGHRGPLAIYAAAHGVSRSTAWRRLKVA